MAILGAGALGAGASVYGASQQAGAAGQASQTQMKMYQQMRNDLMPYNLAGQAATNQLMNYWGLTPASGGAGGAAGMTPGMQAAMNMNSSGGFNMAGLLGGIGLGHLDHGRSYIKDIADAVQNGLPVTDADWAKAGYGPGGLALDAQGKPIPMAAGTAGGGAPTAASARGAFDALTQYPGYQFQYGQGLEALNRNLAAGGRYTSGAMMKGAQAYGQGFAQNSVNQYLDMLKFLSQGGQNAAAQVGQTGASTGQGIAQSQMAGATAQSAGFTGAANALSGALQGYAYQNALNPANAFPASIGVTPQIFGSNAGGYLTY